ncbi:MAG: LamG-like jellyroll fold domain-containing protein, partial [Planctomycetota bacterium]
RALPAASWTHLVIVRDLTNRKLRWYADGIETDTGPARFTSARASDLPAYLGRGYVGGFEGLLDDVRVYDRALSQDEIHELAAMGESDPGPRRPIVQRPVPARPERARLPTRALSVFDSLVERGDYAGARRAAENAAADRANADDADVLLAAARVAAKLEERAGAARRGAESRAGRKVELRAKAGTRRGTLDQVTDEGIVLSTAYTINKQVRRKRLTVKWSELSPAQMDDFAREGGWRTRGADGAVASAYLARARRDFSAAMKALGSAGGHPLAPHVREKVEAPGLAAAGAAARTAWARIERSAAALRVRSYRSVPAEFRNRGWIGLSSGPYRSYCVAFSPDGRYLASGGYSTSSSTGVRSTPVGMWEASTGRKVKAFVGMANYAHSIAFSRDGKKLAAGGQDGSVMVWDVASEALLKRFMGQTQYVMAVAFSPDGRILAAASRDSTASLWDASTGNLLRSVKGDTTYRYVYAAAFSPDGRWLATGGYDRCAAMWVLPAGVKKRLLTGHTGYVKSLAFSSNGRYVATGSYDNTAALWNVLTGTRVRTFEGLASCVYSVALSSDGRMLATGCADGTVALWDCSTSRKLKTFGPKAGEAVTSSNYINSVAISPDGQFLATGGYRTTNRIWLIREKAKLAPQEARLLLDRLAAFEREHGRTEFALSVAGKIANMKAAASRWLDK